MSLKIGSINGQPFILAENMFPDMPEDQPEKPLSQHILDMLETPGILPETRQLIEAAAEAQRKAEPKPEE